MEITTLDIIHEGKTLGVWTAAEAAHLHLATEILTNSIIKTANEVQTGEARRGRSGLPKVEADPPNLPRHLNQQLEVLIEERGGLSRFLITTRQL